MLWSAWDTPCSLTQSPGKHCRWIPILHFFNAIKTLSICWGPICLRNWTFHLSHLDHIAVIQEIFLLLYSRWSCRVLEGSGDACRNGKTKSVQLQWPQWLQWLPLFSWGWQENVLLLACLGICLFSLVPIPHCTHLSLYFRKLHFPCSIAFWLLDGFDQ